MLMFRGEKLNNHVGEYPDWLEEVRLSVTGLKPFVI